MTSPRSSYGGGYHTAPSFPDTPIYDSLVAERGMPQIAPIRVPAAYEAPVGYPAPAAPTGSYLPALPAALPALPSAPSPQPAPAYHGGGYGYPQPAPQMQAAPPAFQPAQFQAAPLQAAPTPYIPQQPAQRGYPQPARPAGGYEAMRPAAPRPAPAPVPAPAQYQDPYNRPYQGGGY